MDEETIEDEKKIMKQTWKKRTQQNYLNGYREGVFDGKEKGYEQGYTDGYKHGFESASSLGIFNGSLKVLEFYSIPTKMEQNTPFNDIQNNICFMCSDEFKQSNNDYDNFGNIIKTQNEYLEMKIKNKLMYNEIIDKYVKVQK